MKCQYHKICKYYKEDSRTCNIYSADDGYCGLYKKFSKRKPKKARKIKWW